MFVCVWGGGALIYNVCINEEVKVICSLMAMAVRERKLENLCVWLRLHNQDGCHAHNMVETLNKLPFQNPYVVEPLADCLETWNVASGI